MSLTTVMGRFVIGLMHLQIRKLSTISPNAKEVNKALGFFGLKRKAQVINQIFGTNLVKARMMIKENRELAKQPVDRYNKLAEILKPWKLISGDPNESLVLFQSSIPVIKSNCDFLLECGVTNPSMDLIAKLDVYFGLSVGLFAGYAKLSSSEELEQKWISLLPNASVQINAWDKLKSHTDTISSAARVRNVIFACFVEEVLVLPFDEALRIVEEGVGASPTCLRKMQATLEFLLSLGFRLKNFSDSPQLLRCDPKSISLFLDTYKDGFLNQPALEFLLKHPEISCHLDFDTLRLNLDALLNVGVPALHIAQYFPQLLMSDFYELTEKIQRLQVYPELTSFCSHPEFPKLLENIETVLLRVEALRGIDRRQITFTACTCSPREFANMVKQRAKYRYSTESLCFAANRTGHTLDEVRRALRNHPHKSQLCIGNVKEVISFLEFQQFKKEQIFQGIQLVLYPVKLIKKGLEQMATRTDMQPWEEVRKESQILTYLQYIVEEQYSFTGNGVFANCDDELPLPSPTLRLPTT